MQAIGRSGWDATSDRWSASAGLGFAEWVLRGIGVVVLQNNPLSGALILAALFLESLAYALACLVGTAISTLAALILGADRGDRSPTRRSTALGPPRSATSRAWPGWRPSVWSAPSSRGVLST
jgi:hypothetical protein